MPNDCNNSSTIPTVKSNPASGMRQLAGTMRFCVFATSRQFGKQPTARLNIAVSAVAYLGYDQVFRERNSATPDTVTRSPLFEYGLLSRGTKKGEKKSQGKKEPVT